MTLKRVCTFSSFLALTLASGAASAAASKLLISEVVSSPTQAEMVAITNTGSAAVDLTDYYLSDYATYYNVVLSTASPANDFLIRFPNAATIQPGETQWVSIAGAVCFNDACGTTGSFTGYGIDPTYEMVLAAGPGANNKSTVPDMLIPFTGAIGSNPGLTNGNEPIILFYWDGTSHLVTDVDYVYYGGAGAGTNAPVNKTGVTVQGSTYLNDTADVPANHAVMTPTTGGTTCRFDFTEGNQTTTGGNGVGGRDETSENWSTTFYPCATFTIGQDSDLDGVPNSIDNCPTQAGPVANNGCPAGTDAGTDAATGGTGGTTDAGTDAATGGTGGTVDAGTDAATGGTGGTTDAGTDAASGGAAGATGGAAGAGGTAGAATGGAAGAATGGAAGAATGGSGGATGGSGGVPIGGSGGTGGTKPSTGGTGGFNFDAGVGGAAGSAGSNDSGGCGCATVGAGSNAGLWAALSLLGLAFGLRRRRNER